MPGYRILKRKKNEIEYIMSEKDKEIYFTRIITINVLLVVGLLLALILI